MRLVHLVGGGANVKVVERDEGEDDGSSGDNWIGEGGVKRVGSEMESSQLTRQVEAVLRVPDRGPSSVAGPAVSDPAGEEADPLGDEL